MLKNQEIAKPVGSVKNKSLSYNQLLLVIRKLRNEKTELADVIKERNLTIKKLRT